jgi:hypothetical protein
MGGWRETNSRPPCHKLSLVAFRHQSLTTPKALGHIRRSAGAHRTGRRHRQILAVGESVQATIEAKKKWNDTGIELVRGHEYRFTARGRWTDWWIECDADGYASPNPILKVAEGLRRSPRSPWFALIGAIDAQNHTQFEIGTEQTLTLGVK